jgi:hypothetical protein
VPLYFLVETAYGVDYMCEKEKLDQFKAVQDAARAVWAGCAAAIGILILKIG